MQGGRLCSATSLVALLALLVVVAVVDVVEAVDNGVAKTPAMGWCAWSGFYDFANEVIVREMVQALIDLGLRDAGYNYFLLDDANMWTSRDWWTEELVADPKKYPSGPKGIGDYLHSFGFKYGVYTDLAKGGCGTLPGSLDYYETDAQSFARWGVDYVKIDTCGSGISWANSTEQLDHWKKMERALNATGRPMYISMCAKRWIPEGATGLDAPYVNEFVYIPAKEWTFADKFSATNSWLVEYINIVDEWYSDIVDNTHCAWAEGYKAPCGLITNIDAVLNHGRLDEIAPGGLMDADELEVCSFGATFNEPGFGMNMAEYRVHFFFWAIAPSALLLSFDARKVLSRDPRGKECISMLLNPEIIAINQDPSVIGAKLIEQGYTGAQPTTPTITYQIIGRKLTPKNTYAGLFINRSKRVLTLRLAWKDLIKDMNPPPVYAKVRDVGQRRDMGVFAHQWSTVVPPHDAVLFTVVAVNNGTETIANEN